MWVGVDFKPDTREAIHERTAQVETRSNASQSELRSAEYPSRVLHHDEVRINSL
jgi:hypothetical protein